MFFKLSLQSEEVQDSIAGIVTCYWLGGLGLESRWWWDFLYPSRLVLELTSLPYNRYQVSSLELKQQRCGIDCPSQSVTKVKERLELYLCFPSEPSWPVPAW